MGKLRTLMRVFLVPAPVWLPATRQAAGSATVSTTVWEPGFTVRSACSVIPQRLEQILDGSDLPIGEFAVDVHLGQVGDGIPSGL